MANAIHVCPLTALNRTRKITINNTPAASTKHPQLTAATRPTTGAKTTVYEVYDLLQLPFAAQCMVEKAGVSVVVAIGFLVADAHWCSKEVRDNMPLACFM